MADHDRHLRDDLDAIARSGSRELERRARRRALAPILHEGARHALVLGGVALGLGTLRLVFAAPIPLSGAVTTAALAAPLLVWLTLHLWTATLGAATPMRAIAALDRQLGLEDRLTNAAEFLDTEDDDPWTAAAIADAARHSAAARTVELERRDVPLGPLGGALGRGLAALALFAAAIFVTPSLEPPAETETPVTSADVFAANEEETIVESDDAPEPPERPADQDGAERPDRRSKKATQGGERADSAGDTPDGEEKKARGRTESGTPTSASSSGGASDSRGTPSSAGQTGESQQKPPRKKRKKKERKPPEESTAPAPKPEEQAGATAGRGAASGSNRSPAASTWASKDQVTSDDEEELEDDEEVVDEEDTSDARGGLQPQLRDRKPPVNRDLTIGFGNGKNPDANGRGGPSQRKKSRGVASLVLGVPIPDHIKGRPNSGRTKITQERVEPQAEDAPAVAASERTPRADAIGRVGRLELSPWMKRFLKDYYLSLRETEKGEPRP